MRFICLLCLFLQISAQEISSTQFPNIFVQNYPHESFDGSPQTWESIQLPDGRMAFANSSHGLQIFDGLSWVYIEMPNRSLVRSLSLSGDSVLYVGAVGIFGKVNLRRAKLTFQPMLDRIANPDPTLTILDVWSTYTIGDHTYFYTDNAVFHLHDNRIRMIRPHRSFFLAHRAGPLLLVQEKGRGLLHIREGRVIRVDSTAIFKTTSFHFSIGLSSDVMLGSRQHGLFRYDPAQQLIEPFKTAAKMFLKDASPYSGARVNDTTIAIGTLRKGVLFLSNDGRIRSIVDKKNGLIDNTCYHVYVDRDQSVWLAQSKGIARIDYSSRFRFWNEQNGLIGAVEDMLIQDDVIYAATLDGVYINRGSGFQAAKNQSSQTWGFLKDGKRILVASSNSLGVIEGDQIRPVANNLRLILDIEFAVDRDTVLIAGTATGVVLLKRYGRNWRVTHKNTSHPYQIRNIMVDEKTGMVWCNTNNNGFLRFPIKGLSDGKLKIHQNRTASGIGPISANRFLLYEKSLVLMTEKGMFSHMPDDTFQPFILDNTRPTIQSRYFIRAAMDQTGNIWASGGSRRNTFFGVFQKNLDGGFFWTEAPFKEIPRQQIYRIYIGPKQQVWIAGTKGIFRFDRSQMSAPKAIIEPRFEAVELAGDSLLHIHPNDHITIGYEASQRYRIHYSLPYYIRSDRSEFRYRLIGFSDEWSNWTTEHTKDYTGLSAGDFEFQLQGRNVFGQETPIIAFQFAIETPWYLSDLFLVLYVLAGFALLYGLYAVRMNQVDKVKRRLESTIRERTETLAKQNTQLSEMNALIYTINSELELDNLVEAVLKHIQKLHHADRIRVLIRQQRDGEFKIRAGRGWNLKQIDDISLSLEDIHSRFLAPADERRPGVYTIKHKPLKDETDLMFSIPLSSLVLEIKLRDNHVIGYLVIDNMDPDYEFAEPDIELLSHLKEHIATATIKANMLGQLQRLNENKNKFLGIAAHDLRSPLANISAYAGLLQEYLELDIINKPKMSMDLEKIQDIANQMSELINELLDYSAIESGKVNLNIRDENLQTVIESIVEFQTRVAEKKDITMTINREFFATLPKVKMDKIKIHEVIDNLISNAIKYTHPGGTIHVDGNIEKDKVVVCVKDSGQGLSSEDLKNVFNTFQTLSAKPTGGEKSTGLGLAIVKKLVELHGGKVWVESEKGEGSTFFFTLKLAS